MGGKRKLAELAGISETQIFRYLKGKSSPPMNNIIALAQAANISPAWLFAGGSLHHGKVLSLPSRQQVQIMQKFLQTFEEALLNYPYSVPNLRKSYFAPLIFWEHIRRITFESADITPRRQMLLQSLYFLDQFESEDLLKVLTHGVIALAEGEEMNTSMLRQLAESITEANIHSFNGPIGKLYFERIGTSLKPALRKKLQDVLGSVYSTLGTQHPLKILDVGCGNGRHLAYLNQNIANISKLAGVDGAEQSIARAKKLEKSGHFTAGTVQLGDARELPYPDDSFNFVHCFSVLQYLPTGLHAESDAQKMMNELYRVLEKGGVLYLNTRAGSQTEFVPFIQEHNEMSLTSLAEKSGFDVQKVHIYEQEENPGLLAGASAPQAYLKRIELFAKKL